MNATSRSWHLQGSGDGTYYIAALCRSQDTLLASTSYVKQYEL